jgi:ligand-binding SRPBCC domain-containing protein
VASRTVEFQVEVAAPVETVWARLVSAEGFNYEMRPWVTMTMPAAARGLSVETVPLGVPLGRAWLRLFGVVPFDYDRLCIVELEPGRRFLERSTMASMRVWEHERTAAATPAGTRVTDRVTFTPRLPLTPLIGPLARGICAFFAHRQRRLRDYYA